MTIVSMIVLLLSILLLMFVVGLERRFSPYSKKKNDFYYVLSVFKDPNETSDPSREWIPIGK